jgi:hypothetical protein
MRALTIMATFLLGGFVRADEPTPKPGDQLDRLIDELSVLDKSAADKLDALFFATRGRLATGPEHRHARSTLGDNPTAAQLRKYVEPSLVFEHKLIGLHLWRPPGLPDNATPIMRSDCFGPGMVIGWYVPAPPLQNTEPAVPGFVPNPAGFPLTPWIPPGSSAPLPRLGAGSVVAKS